MSKIMRMVVLVVSLTSLLGAMSSSAGAITWTNAGDTAFTATAGPSTMSVTGSSLTCTGESWTSTTGTAPFAGAVWPAIRSTRTLSGCRLFGISTGVHCNHEFTAGRQTSGVTHGVDDITCWVYQAGRQICHIEGEADAHYVKPPGRPGFIHLTHSDATMTNGAVGTCPLSPGEPFTLPTRIIQITSATGGPAPHTGPVFSTDA
jgi:hypothetical protein